MIKANEAREITKKAIEEKKEEEMKKMENFLLQAEAKIKANAEKGQTICYISIPEEFRYNEYKFMEAFIEYGYARNLIPLMKSKSLGDSLMLPCAEGSIARATI